MADNTCSFTNNSGQTVTVLSGANEPNTSPKQGYEQTLTQLFFEGGSKTLADGAMGTLELPDNQPVVNLLVSDPATLKPVMAVGEVKNPETGLWPPVTIPATQQEAIKQAMAFRQNLMTSPSSTLAEGFQQALSFAQSQKTPDEMIAVMDKFFQDQPKFDKVTFADYTAVETYLKAFAQLWVQKNDLSGSNSGGVYNVYSAPTAGAKGAKIEGKITATAPSSSPAAADPQNHLSGYTISFSGTPLSYTAGVFSDADNAVVLSATFAFKGRFTGDVKDVELWPVLIGTIQSKQMIALPYDAPSESSFAKWWSEQNFNSIFGLTMGGIFLFVGIGMIVIKIRKAYKGWRAKKARNRGRDPNSHELEDILQNANRTEDNARREANGRLRRVAGNSSRSVPRDSELRTRLLDQRGASYDTMSDLARTRVNGSIQSTGQTLEDIGRIESTPALQKAATSLNKAGAEAQRGDISGASSSLQTANDQAGIAVKDLGQQITEQQREAFNKKIAADKASARDAEEREKEAKESKDGREPEGEPVEVEPR